MTELLRILFVEDLPTDMELAEYHLRGSGFNFTSLRVDDRLSLIKELNDFNPHIVISDYSMPSFDGMQALRVCLDKDPDLPVIILTGSMNESTAVACLKAGATDYVIKEHLMRLPFAVKDALEHADYEKSKKNAENALIRSEANLRSLLNNSDDRLWSVDTQYRLLTGNTVFQFHAEKTFGKKFEFGEYVFPADLPEDVVNEWKGYWNRAFHGERFVIEKNLESYKPYLTIEYHFSPLVGSQGEILGGVATGHDITARIKTEKKLQEQEEELSAIFENSPILMIVVDEERKIKKINGVDLTGDIDLKINGIDKPLGNAIKCVNALSTPEGCGFSKNCHHCEVRNLVTKTLETGVSSYQVDVNLTIGEGSDSKELDLLMSTTLLHIRNKPMVLMSMLDISEKKKAEHQLLRERSLLRTLIDNLPDRVFFKDRNSRFIIANEGVARHIGVASTDQLIGKSDLDFYPPEHARKYLEDEQELINSDYPLINHEEPARDAEGNIGWTLTSKIPVKDINGNPVGLVGISRDITEQKKVNQELIEAKNLAEQANRLKDAFIANMSHEIRTPLNSILGFSDLVRESYIPYRTDETDKYFDIIDQSSHRLMRTVDMILSMSRLQVGEITVTPKAFNLEISILKLINQYSLVAQKKSIDLEFKSTCADSTIISDDYCVSHSISNLIDNAIKYTKSGSVFIHLSETSGPGFCLSVKDTGIGISDEYKSVLFSPFSQEVPGISRPYEGIGLGLSLTKRLLDTIGCEIRVESERGVGSVFTVLFPKDISSADIGSKIGSRE